MWKYGPEVEGISCPGATVASLCQATLDWCQVAAPGWTGLALCSGIQMWKDVPEVEGISWPAAIVAHKPLLLAYCTVSVVVISTSKPRYWWPVLAGPGIGGQQAHELQ